MSLRKKLFTSISAVFLLVVLLVVGVWAVTSVNYSTGGTVSFIAIGVNADIYQPTNEMGLKTITGGHYKDITDGSGSVAEGKMQAVSINTTDDDTALDKEKQTLMDTWKGLELVFPSAEYTGEDDDGNEVWTESILTITFCIQNTSIFSDEVLILSIETLDEGKKFQYNPITENATISVDVNKVNKNDLTTNLLAEDKNILKAETESGTADSITINQNEIAIVKITFSIIDRSINATPEFNIPFVLEGGRTN